MESRKSADSRKPLGFAEVSLTFTDCAQELGTDWHDVRVTRRVYKDGNSEYLLNKTVCRLISGWIWRCGAALVTVIPVEAEIARLGQTA
ncbi:MAG: hypothetical protein H0V56_10520 [Chthoniobacterales bacterium]|nr:hypothetical protein [Chthoniobacterales bacterium]